MALDLVGAERLAVGGAAVGLVGRGPADVTAEDQHRGTVLDRHRPADARFESVEVVGDLAQVLDVPAIGLEALAGIVVEGELGGSVDGDVVVVVHVDEPAEAEMAGERRGLVADALHEIAVAAEDEGVVVDDLGSEPGPEHALGDSHADTVGETLTERPGRDLDARYQADLGMTGRAAVELAEVAQVVEAQVIPGQMQHRVGQDRRVATRKDEAVAVGPAGIGRIVAHDPGPQHVGEWRQGHRRARMAGPGRLRRVHGQTPNDVDAQLLEIAVAHVATLPMAVPIRFRPN